jgi:hypothetical protein
LDIGQGPERVRRWRGPQALEAPGVNANYSVSFLYFALRRRPRSTVKPPANIVNPVIADAGSISGAETAGGEPGEQKVNHRTWMQPLWLLLAEAMPATLINTTAKLIFLNTLLILELERENAREI